MDRMRDESPMFHLTVVGLLTLALFFMLTSLAGAQTATLYVCWDAPQPGTTIAPTGFNIYRSGVRLWTVPGNEVCSPLPSDLTVATATATITVSAIVVAPDGTFESAISSVVGTTPMPPQPTPTSTPDCMASIAPTGTLTASDGATWTWSGSAGLPAGNYHAFRNGADTGGGGGQVKNYQGAVYILGDDSTPTWYRYANGTFTQVGPDPCPSAPPPQPVGPTASLTVSPTTVQVGQPVTLSTSGSIEGSSGITSWQIAFGDGTTQTGTNLPPLTLAKVYTATGSYTPTLRLTDANSLSATSSAMIVTVQAAPTPPDPCTTTPLRFSVSRWPAQATGSRQLTYSSDRPVVISLDMRVTPWVLVATDARQCSVRLTH